MKPTVETLLRSRLKASLEETDSAAEKNSFHNRLLLAPREESLEIRKCYFSPHSLEYISPLRPLFLGHVESPDVTGWISPLLVRDGLLSLAHFFHKTPSPPRSEEGALLLVNQRFAPLVPEAWAEQVAFYSVRPTPQRSSAPKNEVREIYLILTAIDERQCSREFLRARLEELRAALGDSWAGVQVNVLPLLCTALAEEFNGVEIQGQYYFECLMAIREALGPNLRCVTWAQLQGRNLKGSLFLDLNEYDFYYSDSFVTRHFLSLGAVPFEARESRPDWDFWIDASLCHGYAIRFDSLAQANPADRAIVREALEFLQSDLYREEEQAFESNPKAPFRRGLKFCPLSFETLIHSVARKLRI